MAFGLKNLARLLLVALTVVGAAGGDRSGGSGERAQRAT